MYNTNIAWSSGHFSRTIVASLHDVSCVIYVCVIPILILHLQSSHVHWKDCICAWHWSHNLQNILLLLFKNFFWEGELELEWHLLPTRIIQTTTLSGPLTKWRLSAPFLVKRTLHVTWILMVSTFALKSSLLRPNSTRQTTTATMTPPPHHCHHHQHLQMVPRSYSMLTSKTCICNSLDCRKNDFFHRQSRIAYMYVEQARCERFYKYRELWFSILNTGFY